MDYGLRWVWVRGGLPFGGDVHLWDDHGDIVCLLDRESFEEDPDGFMDSLERHQDVNVKGHGWTLELPVAAGDGRVPRSFPRHLATVAVLPLTGCAWIAATFAQGLGPVVGS